MITTFSFLSVRHVCAFLLSMLPVVLHAQPTADLEPVKLVFNQNEAVQDVARDVLTTIYRRAGLALTTQALPPARANVVTLAGQTDGEVARIDAYFIKNPSLVKVEPSYHHLVITAFTRKDRQIVIRSREDLKQYRVGIVRGVVFATLATDGVAQREVTDSVEQLFRMLDAGRIDVAVDIGVNGRDLIQKLDLSSVNVAGELGRHGLYNVLTPANAALAPRIGTVIKAMNQSGELKRLISAAENRRLGVKSGASH